MQKIMFDNGAARSQLTELLREPRPVLLLVGSGSSRSVGYPSWPSLLEQLRKKLIPNEHFPENNSLLQKASFIYNKLRNHEDSEEKLKQYLYELENTFRPDPRTCNYIEFHRTLVRLPFCGVVTTNYDSVLESAIGSVRSENKLDSQCDTVNLCMDPEHRVWKFIQDLNSNRDIFSVLHLHGHWKHPEKIILTEEDYKEYYEIVIGSTTSDNALKTLHQKVLWNLLTNHPVVFVGFGLRDPAFDRMLSCVREDFDLPPSLQPHFALLPSVDKYDQEQEQNECVERLRYFGVLPVFYQATQNNDGSENHDALPALIEELAADLDTPNVRPPLNRTTRRLLEL